MLSIDQQIESGALVCPASHQRLSRQGDQLVTADGEFSYAVVGEVPVLLDREKQEAYLAQQDGSMQEQYTTRENRSLFVKWSDRLNSLGGDYRSDASREAFQRVVADQPPEALCLSVGGGPLRVHSNLVNLNISLFDNVDVVGDAYTLPYADLSVDSIFCEAVLEHLEFPNQAVGEMYRTLRPSGQVLAVTPHLQAFHAYPDHYQNFTLVGHQRLLERAGFEILSSGLCVGPTVALVSLLTLYSGLFPTPILRKMLPQLVRLLGVALRPLDLFFNRSPLSHILASTTYVHARKPA